MTESGAKTMSCDHSNWACHPNDFVGTVTCNDCGESIRLSAAITGDHLRLVALVRKYEAKLFEFGCVKLTKP